MHTAPGGRNCKHTTRSERREAARFFCFAKSGSREDLAKKRAAGAVSDDSFSRSCFPQPDAMARSAPNVFLRTVREFGLGADPAIACPCRVTETTRTGQGITSFVRETYGRCHQRVAPRSYRIGPSGHPAALRRAKARRLLLLCFIAKVSASFLPTRPCVVSAQVQLYGLLPPTPASPLQ
jgi:hypothetical protein